MNVSSEDELMELVRKAGKKPDAAGFSKALNELRSKGYLKEKNIETIEGWIKSEFPSSIRYLARELLKGEDTEDEKKDEKEQEEKIPSWDARNICSSATLNDLSGDDMPRDLREVVSFLLPRGGKSECLTESDLRTLLRPKAEWDQIYLFDPKLPASQRAILSVPVHRLPSSGIWIVGSAPYLRMLKAYQLESFGKHPIGATIHTRSGIYGEVNELFLAKPLHYDDFKALIVNNTLLPPAPTACVCLFKPHLEDWSETFKVNYPVKDCEWIIPTWNGFPVILGKDCGKLLHWDYASITPPAAEAISIHPELEDMPELEPDESEADIELDRKVKAIIDAYWDIINKKMSLVDEHGNVMADASRFPLKTILLIKEADSVRQITLTSDAVNTEEKRVSEIEKITEFFADSENDGIEVKLKVKWPGRPPRVVGPDGWPIKVHNVKSESEWFNPSQVSNINWRSPYQIEITAPFIDAAEENNEEEKRPITKLDAKNIINAYWEVINNKMDFIKENGQVEISLNSFPIASYLDIKSGDNVTTIRPRAVNTEAKRESASNDLYVFISANGGNIKKITLSIIPPLDTRERLATIHTVLSESPLFNDHSPFEVRTVASASTLNIENPFHLPEEDQEIENALDVAVELEAKNIITNYWDSINKKMEFVDMAVEPKISLNEFPIKAILRVRIVDNPRRSIAFRPDEVDTATKRVRAINDLIEFFGSISGNVTETTLIVRVASNTPQSILNNIIHVKSESKWFNNDASLTVRGYTIEIVNPFKSEFPDEESPQEASHSANPSPPASFKTGKDFVKWVRHHLRDNNLRLQDYRSRNTVSIIPDSAGIVRMRLQLRWSGDREVAFTPATLEDENEKVEEYDSQASLRSAELRIASSSLEGATPGSTFVVRPWHSGHVTDSGKLIMNWTASDLADESENERSDSESEREDEEEKKNFETGEDFVNWMQRIIPSDDNPSTLRDAENSVEIKIGVDPSDGIAHMRLKLVWTGDDGDRKITITPETLDYNDREVKENDAHSRLSAAKFSVGSGSVEGTPGPFAIDPWNSGNITQSGKLVMKWERGATNPGWEE